MSDLNDQELAKKLVDQKKWLHGNIELTVKQHNKRYHICEFRVEDDEFSTIPKVIISISLRVGFIPEECLYTFSIFWQDGGKKYRAYQLEVCPPKKRSHNGGKKSASCHGPHEHIGNEVKEVRTGLGCADHHDWFKWFCDRINLTVDGSVCSPFGGSDD
ncbi:hypothetical protein [Alloalcanivorax xenomutans]|uniref:hypothetical protein n=1 Tax=Alloalcanivorax xenomutans TaxID=1094342 RepID=UPI003BACC164